MKPKTRLHRWLRRNGWPVPRLLQDRATLPMHLLAKTFGPQDVVIDLGAHIGLATTEFAQTAGEVHSFEPNPVNYAELQKHTQRYTNVTLHNAAVSDSDGTLDLFFETPKPGKFYEGATIVQNKSNVTYENKVSVKTIDFAQFIEDLGKPVAAVKMDIEGAEYLVLERLIDSGAMDKIGMIYAECHVDRIPNLAEDKARVLAKFEAAGIAHKLNLEWQ